jgi:hypothetical protein
MANAQKLYGTPTVAIAEATLRLLGSSQASCQRAVIHASCPCRSLERDMTGIGGMAIAHRQFIAPKY